MEVSAWTPHRTYRIDESAVDLPDANYCDEDDAALRPGNRNGYELVFSVPQARQMTALSLWEIDGPIDPDGHTRIRYGLAVR